MHMRNKRGRSKSPSTASCKVSRRTKHALPGSRAVTELLRWAVGNAQMNSATSEKICSPAPTVNIGVSWAATLTRGAAVAVARACSAETKAQRFAKRAHQHSAFEDWRARAPAGVAARGHREGSGEGKPPTFETTRKQADATQTSAEADPTQGPISREAPEGRFNLSTARDALPVSAENKCEALFSFPLRFSLVRKATRRSQANSYTHG